MKGDKAEYVIPLRQAFNTPRSRRADKAIFLIREFVKKHTRAAEKDIAISNEVNQYVWKQSRSSIPRKIDAVLRREDKRVFVFLKGGKEIELRTAKVEEPKEKKKKEAKPKKEEKKPEGKAEAKAEAKPGAKPEEKKPSEKEIEEKKKLEEKREKEKNSMKADFK